MNNWLKNNQKLNAVSLLGVVFQQHCALCDATTTKSHSLCDDCIDSLPKAPQPCCMQCGRQANAEVCGHCLKQTPHYDRTSALFSYRFPTDALLQQYKYRQALYLSQTLGKLLAKHHQHHAVNYLVPMPLHPDRLKTRGFNQSLEIAKTVTKQLNIPFDNTSVQRVKNTAPQASLPLKDRLKNVRNAFATTPEAADKFKGKRIAIIDDVMTTGSSLDELAKTIKKAGAKQVECWVIARALTQ